MVRGAALLEALFHLTDTVLESFELRSLGVELLFPVMEACLSADSKAWLRIKGQIPDRLSTCSSRSATLFSMRKISISSCEKERAMVLQSRRSSSQH